MSVDVGVDRPACPLRSPNDTGNTLERPGSRCPSAVPSGRSAAPFRHATVHSGNSDGRGYAGQWLRTARRASRSSWSTVKEYLAFTATQRAA